ncbi:hypothetical protein SteCoe_24076 [Stentor coeruleus]|uniref:Uncharacterized protein n=1 Tax=Stentor coeruleus TaxID=5963 RepID=A0A1R2BIF8_9CILI|nr:hypothetical protein SteCoe_24076 [Stentor coeruleus]
MKRKFDSTQNPNTTSSGSPNPKLISNSYQQNKLKPLPLDFSAEMACFSPPRTDHKAYLSPHSMNSFDIEFSAESFREKCPSRASKIRFLEMNIEQNRLSYENEKKVMKEYIELLKRKLYILTNGDGKVCDDASELSNENFRLKDEVSSLKSIISDKEGKILTLQDEIQAKSSEILQLTKRLEFNKSTYQNPINKNDQLSAAKLQENLQYKLKIENINLMEQLKEKEKEIQFLRTERKYTVDAKAPSYKQLTIELKDKVNKSMEMYEKEINKIKDQVERLDSRLILSAKSIRFLQNNNLVETYKSKELEKKSENFLKAISTRNEALNSQADAISSLEEKIKELHNTLADKDENIDKLRQEIFEYKISFDGQKTKFDGIIQQKDREIYNIKAKLGYDAKKQDDKIISLQNSLLDVSKENLRLHIEIEERKNDCLNKSDEIKAQEKKIRSLEDKTRVLQLQVIENENKEADEPKDKFNYSKLLDEKSKLMQTFELSMTEQKIKQRDLNERLEKTKNKLKKMLEINREAERNIKNSLQRNDCLKSEITEKDSVIICLQKKIDEMEKVIKDLDEKTQKDKVKNKEVEEIKHQKQISEIEVKEKSKVIEYQREIISELELAIKKCTNELMGIKEELAKKEKADSIILENVVLEKNIEIEECKMLLKNTISEKDQEIFKLQETISNNETIYNIEIENLQKSLAQAETSTSDSLKDKEKLNYEHIDNLKTHYENEIGLLTEKLAKTEQEHQNEIFCIEGQYNIKLDKLKQEDNLKMSKLNMEKGIIEKELDAKNNKIIEITEELDKIKQEANMKTNKVKLKKGALEIELEEKNAKIKEIIEESNQERQENNLKINKLNLENEQLNNKLEEKNNKIKEILNNFEKFKQEENMKISKLYLEKEEFDKYIEEKDNKIKEILGELNKTKQEEKAVVNKLTTEKNSFEKQHDEKVMKIKELQEQINQLKQENITKINKLKIEKDAIVKELEEKNNNMNNAIEELNKTKQEEKSKICKISLEKRELENDLEVKNAKIKELLDEFNHLKQEEKLKTCKLNLEKVSLEKELEEKTTEIKTILGDIDKLKLEIKKADFEWRRDNDNMKKFYDGLLNKIEISLQSIWDQIKSKDFSNFHLETNDHDNENMVKIIFSYINRIDSGIKCFDQELNIITQLKTQLIQKTQETEESVKRIKSLLNENATLKYQEEKNKKLIELKKDNMEKQNFQIEEIILKVSEYEKIISQKKTKCKEKSLKISKLEKENQELIKKIDGYESIVNELHDGISSNEEKRKEIEDSLMKQIHLAKSEVKRLNTVDEKNKDDIKILKEIIGKLEGQINLLEKDKQKIIEDNEIVRNRVLELEKKNKCMHGDEFNQYKMHIKELENLLQELSRKITDLQKQIDQDQVKIKKLREKNLEQNNPNTVKRLEMQLKEKDNECYSLQKDIEMLLKGTEKISSVKDTISSILKEVREQEQMFKDLRAINIHTFEGRQALKILKEKSEEQERSSTELAALVMQIIESIR